MQSIGLIYAKSEFESLEYHTKGLEEAIVKRGIPCLSYHIDRDGIYSLMQSISDREISHFITFKRMSGGPQSASIQNMFDAPIMLGLVECSFHYHKHAHEKTPVICIDQKDKEFLESLGNHCSIFQPLGARIHPVSKEKKDHDVVFFGNLVDPEELLLKAKAHFSKEVLASIQNIVQHLLYETNVSHLELFMHFIGKYDFDYIQNQPLPIFCTLEYLLRSLDRVRLIKSIRKHDVHLYGIPRWKKGWKELFGSQNNVHLHGDIPYSQTIEIMGRSNVVLNSSPHMRYGVHDRMLYSLMVGTPCLSSPGPYFEKFFHQDTGVLTYRHEALEKVDDLIDQAKRLPKEAILQGRELVRKQFSWDAWLEHYLRSLPDVYNPEKHRDHIRG